MSSLRLDADIGCPHCFYSVKPFVEATEDTHLKVRCPRKDCYKSWMVERRWTTVNRAEVPQ